MRILIDPTITHGQYCHSVAVTSSKEKKLPLVLATALEGYPMLEEIGDMLKYGTRDIMNCTAFSDVFSTAYMKKGTSTVTAMLVVSPKRLLIISDEPLSSIKD